MKLSIVTINRNNAEGLRKTIESVLSQTYREIEYIIIDGGSKDGTIDIIKKYEANITKWVTEQDKGIYDAMNKGITMATGDVIGLLNSDDKYANNKVLEKIAKTVSENKCDGIHGNLLYMDQETISKPKRKWITKSTNIKAGNITAHPTLYLKKQVYDKIGLYNLKYKIVADYDFMVKVLTDKDIKLVYINEYLIHMRLGGTSSAGLKGYLCNLKESYQILKDNKIKFAALISLIRIIKTIWQMVTAKFVTVKE